MSTRIFAMAATAIASVGLLLGCGGTAARRASSSPGMLGHHAGAPVQPVALAAASDANAEAIEIIGQTDRLTVMSFNMEHRDRPNELASIADDLRGRTREIPDFILLQEVVFERSRRQGEANTAEVLGNNLEFYCRGTKRSSDREGIAILSRYPFEYYASRELEAQTSRALFGFNRVSVMGEFRVPDVGRVRVVNVHLTNWGFEERVRRKQLTETLQWIAQRQREAPADAIILGGDFNIQPQWDELDLVFNTVITGGIEYRNYNDSALLTRGGKGDPSVRVDYIFIATPGQRSELAHVDEQCLWRDGVMSARGRAFYPSDHLPVLHEYRVLNAAAPAMATVTAE